MGFCKWGLSIFKARPDSRLDFLTLSPFYFGVKTECKKRVQIEGANRRNPTKISFHHPLSIPIFICLRVDAWVDAWNADFAHRRFLNLADHLVPFLWRERVLRRIEDGSHFVFAYDGIKHPGVVDKFAVGFPMAYQVDGKLCHLAYFFVKGHAGECLFHLFFDGFVAGYRRSGGACRSKRHRYCHTRHCFAGLFYCGSVLFLEKLWSELGEIDAPVFPDVAFGSLVISVFVPFVVKQLAVVLVGLIKEVLVTDGNPVEGGLFLELSFEFSFDILVDGLFRVLAGHYDGGEEAHIVEHVGVFLRDVQRVKSTHGEAGDGAAFLRFDSAVVFVDEIHHIGEVLLE